MSGYLGDCRLSEKPAHLLPVTHFCLEVSLPWPSLLPFATFTILDTFEAPGMQSPQSSFDLVHPTEGTLPT